MLESLGSAVGDVVTPVAGGEFGPLDGFAAADVDEVGEDGCGYLPGEGEHGGAARCAGVDALVDEDSPDGFGGDGSSGVATGEQPGNVAAR